MRRRITLSIALMLSATLLSLLSSDSTAKAQNRLRAVADAGVVKLGPNQVLRMTAVGGDGKLLGNVLLSFRTIGYVEADNVYKVAFQATTNPVRLMEGEAISFDFNRDQVDAVRGVVLSNRPDVRVTAAIINTVTGETTSHIIIANTEGDVH